jgi:hypothetical protein
MTADTMPLVLVKRVIVVCHVIDEAIETGRKKISSWRRGVLAAKNSGWRLGGKSEWRLGGKKSECRLGGETRRPGGSG